MARVDEGFPGGVGLRAVPQSVVWLALFTVAVHLVMAGRYGIFRDELYYVACARHLAWGYVDHPPLIALVTWVVIHTLGTTLFALRLLPALASGGLVWMTAGVAREMGGGRVAQTFAGLAIVPVPIYLILDHWLTMNAFEPLLWTGVLWCAVRMINSGDARYWVWIGVLAGVGFENKYSMLFCVAGLIVGLALSRERKLLYSRWLLVGVGVGALLFLPNLLWLVHHNFPFLEFERNSRASGSRILRGPLAFVWDQIVIMNPVVAPLWVGGVAWLLVSREAKRYRALGWAFAVVFLLLLGMKAKNYYVTPIYPLVFAAGAVALEQILKRRWIRVGYGVGIVVSGLVLAPLVMPVLSPKGFVEYRARLGGFTPVQFEDQPAAELPQYFSDEFGWERMAVTTAKVYNALPEPQRSATAIFANDYGEAAAIDFFGPRYGLPSAISKNESYWMWGPRGYTGDSVIVLGSDGKGDREHFRTVDAVGLVSDPDSRADEQFTIFLCRDLSTSLAELWPKIKSW